MYKKTRVRSWARSDGCSNCEQMSMHPRSRPPPSPKRKRAMRTRPGTSSPISSDCGSAETHPEHVRAMLLRGVLLLRPEELDWFYRDGASRFQPEAWARFAIVGTDDLIAAYYALLCVAGRRRSRARVVPVGGNRVQLLAECCGHRLPDGAATKLRACQARDALLRARRMARWPRAPREHRPYPAHPDDRGPGSVRPRLPTTVPLGPAAGVAGGGPSHRRRGGSHFAGSGERPGAASVELATRTAP